VLIREKTSGFTAIPGAMVIKSMEENPSSEADSHSAGKEVPGF
jgi:hypothetical protein